MEQLQRTPGVVKHRSLFFLVEDAREEAELVEAATEEAARLTTEAERVVQEHWKEDLLFPISIVWILQVQLKPLKKSRRSQH